MNKELTLYGIEPLYYYYTVFLFPIIPPKKELNPNLQKI
jgi:hypothetical protein